MNYNQVYKQLSKNEQEELIQYFNNKRLLLLKEKIDEAQNLEELNKTKEIIFGSEVIIKTNLKVRFSNVKPIKPTKPLSAFFLFSEENRQLAIRNVRDGDPEKISKEIFRLWNDSSDNIKNKYKGKAKKLMEKYQKELNEYTIYKINS